MDSAITQLLDSGAMADLGWPQAQARQNTKRFLQRWLKQQEGMTTTVSTVSYVELKELASSASHKKVIEELIATDSSKFTHLESTPTHSRIVDTRDVVLGYRYRVPKNLLGQLVESTSRVPHRQVQNTVRGSFINRHYAVWRDYAMVPFLSAEYRQDLPASLQWLEANRGLFTYLSNGLRMISPMNYARYAGTKPVLEKLDLEPLCGVWYGAAINQETRGASGTHQDWGDFGLNCVIPWGEYQGGGLVLWQLGLVVELRPGDAFFFMGSLIAHNVKEMEDVRNSIDLFCHGNVLTWKDKEDKKEKGRKW
ncbi:MAG: hypothetical protein M1816_005091 [Peltula sp. TS41687]|nr:MAG: hypothetical protein M1816_005091 [Peltula sp. TS41687]